MIGSGSLCVYRVGGIHTHTMTYNSNYTGDNMYTTKSEGDNKRKWELFIGDHLMNGKSSNGAEMKREPFQQIREIEKYARPGEIIISSEALKVKYKI